MKKTVFTIVLASTLLLTACGTSTGKKESETTTATITTSETETTTTEETIDEDETSEDETDAPDLSETTKGLPEGYPTIEEVQDTLYKKINKGTASVRKMDIPFSDPNLLGFKEMVISDSTNNVECAVLILLFDTNSDAYKNLVVGEKFETTAFIPSDNDSPLVVTAINGPYVLSIYNTGKTDKNKSVAPFKYSNSQAIYDAFVAINK